MIETGWLPGRGSMAALAALAQRSLVEIVVGMTGEAVHRCALENAIDMTFCASYAAVGTIQLKGGQVMVKARPGPCAGIVTALAVRSHRTLVLVI